MRDLRRISGLAILLVVLLRLSIGWQFLYEGLWKITSQDGPNPWTAEGYLKNSEGPLRDHFRGLTGDPDDLGWLDSAQVEARWNDWQQRFQAHYALDERQQRMLDQLLNGPKVFAEPLAQLPTRVEIPAPLNRIVKYDAQRKALTVDGRAHLLPHERDAMIALAPGDDEASQAWRRAVANLQNKASWLSFKERLRVLLDIDPDRAGLVLKHGDEVIESRMGDIELYRRQLERYEAKRAVAQTSFEREHLDKQWRELQDLRARLVGPVKALDADLREQALKLLTAEQFARGPVPAVPTQLSQIDWLTMWALTVIGVLLIAGFATPIAAIAGAGLLMLFYLAMPPWPGVPQPPGPEHSFIVNKNLIEAVALLAIAALPTGRWFGLDALFYGLFVRLRDRRRSSHTTAARDPQPAPSEAPKKTREPAAT